MPSFLLVVFDGLRPDMIGPRVTPNLVRFGAMGTRFPFARSVFPSETRVCSTSVATGCHPWRHGVVANRMAHPAGGGAMIDTGDAARLIAFEDEVGEPLVQMPTLGEVLAAWGRSFTVISSGSTGQTFVLNPRADRLGQIVVSAHGPAASSAAAGDLFARAPLLPHGAVARMEWAAELFRREILPEPPDAAILWLCEPDTSGHYGGLNSPAQQAALHRADATFGRILDDWEAGPQRQHLQIMVASDHGHTAVTGFRDVRAALDAVPDFAGCTLLRGSSGGIVVPGADAARISRIAAWLTEQDWVGSVLAAAASDLPPGVLSRDAALIEHPRAAEVLFTLRNDEAVSPAGLPGGSLLDGDLALGAGTHGGLSRPEMRTVLMLAGSRMKRGWISDWPAGLTDIAPTVLHLLGIGGGEAMDGRVLVETFADGEEPAENRLPETWEASAPGYSQVLARVRMGRHVWIDGGERH